MNVRDPWLCRLEKEHSAVKEFCANSDKVTYSASLLQDGLPPDRYLVKYKLRSIISIDEKNMPVYGNEHLLDINLPHDYPIVSGPMCKMISNIWHPNIRHEGKSKGRICINSYALGSWTTLDLLIHHIGEMLQYKNYHAENRQPYPEDPIVANWVREYAEPNGIISKNTPIDRGPLRKPSTEWLGRRKTNITINRYAPNGVI